MKNPSLFLLLSVLLLIYTICIGQTNSSFEQQATDTASLFMPGKISNEYSNRDMAISPDGKEIFYTIQYGALSFIMHTKKEKNGWSNPEIASFSGKYNDLEPAFSSDGNRIYFASNRPLSNSGDSIKDYDIWYVSKVSGKWTNPVNLGGVVNSNKDEFYPSISKSNNIYFTRDMGKTKEDIVCALYKNGSYDSLLVLPTEINSDGFEFNAFVPSDESYLIFSGYNRADGFGSADLYISKKNEQGKWMPAKNMGSKINSSFLDYCPFVSFDGKYFFFTSKRNTIQSPLQSAVHFAELKNIIHQAMNGADDIYWINFKVLDK